MTDKYNKKYIQALKKCTTDEERVIVLDRLYLDGFQDGFDEGEKEKCKKK